MSTMIRSVSDDRDIGLGFRESGALISYMTKDLGALSRRPFGGDDLYGDR